MPETEAGPTILMIEDNSNIRKMAEIRLKREGYQVLTASGGSEGLRLAAAEHPDLILLDIIMPTMDGREVLRRLKADAKTQAIPVILLTVIGAHDEMYAPIEPGAVDHLSKPYQPHELLQRIKWALSTRRE